MDEEKKKELEAQIKKLEDTSKEVSVQMAALEKAKSETADYESKVAGLKQEEARVQTALAAAREEKRKAQEKDLTFQEKFKSEQMRKAEDKFFKEFGYDKPEMQDEFRKKFSGSSAIDAENIFNDMVKTHVAENAALYIDAAKRAKALESGAAEYIASSAGANLGMGNLGAAGDDELTNEEKIAAKWSGLTEERYKELKKKGKL